MRQHPSTAAPPRDVDCGVGVGSWAASTPTGGGRRWTDGPGRPDLVLGLVVFLAAVTCRVGLLVRDGGLRGRSGYDAPVYFAAADALVHGRMPYRDFTLLHPPGIALVLSPFAELTRVVPDMTAFMIANLATALVGGTCALLVLRICRGLGLGRTPSFLGGLFYATWFGAVDVEFHTKLEPFGNLLLLGGVLAALGAQRTGRGGRAVAAGALLGLALTVKIWWVVPVLGVLLWHGLVTRSAGAVARMAGGVAGAATLVCLPFFLLAPRQMWDSVILDQLGRRRMDDTLRRVSGLATISAFDRTASARTTVIAGLLVAALLVTLAIRAWRVRTARPVVVLLASQLVVLFAAPSWFAFYDDYIAGALSITVAAAAATTSPWHRSRHALWRGAPTGAAAAVTLLVLVSGSAAAQPLPGQDRLRQAVAGVHCVMSDSPMGLIELDALSRDFAHGCRNWVDVTGRTYGPDKLAGRTRGHNPRWQADLRRYLRSGNAVIVVRRRGSGITARTEAAISRDGVLARADGQTVYRVTHR